jgi:hypothetical protein
MPRLGESCYTNYYLEKFNGYSWVAISTGEAKHQDYMRGMMDGIKLVSPEVKTRIVRIQVTIGNDNQATPGKYQLVKASGNPEKDPDFLKGIGEKPRKGGF